MLFHFLMDFYILYFFQIHIFIFVVAVVQSLSCVQFFMTPWTATYQAPLFSTVCLSLPKCMSTQSVVLSNHVIFCGLLFLLSSIFPSIRVFSRASALCIRWSKYWSFSFSTVLGRIFRVDFRVFHLAVQGTLKSFLQQHTLKTSIFQLSAFMVQLWRLYMTTGKNITLILYGPLSVK